jgi:TM2 domain-containing membrane protein YozV
MSDETRDDLHNDGWTPVDTGIPTPGPGTSTGSASAGFCQDCGRPLTTATVRNVGASLFCEPCLTARVGTPQPAPGDASPVLAAFLGIIPGVGAMYNGQYAKGFFHLAVFAILTSLSDHVHSIFGILVVGWFFYQIFDAYQTAKARRDGMPLPDPLGLNHIGERMGFGRTWGFTSNPRPAQPPAPGAPVPPTPYAPPPPAGYAPGGQAPRPDWVGYVPPTAFAGAPPVPPVDPATAAAAQQAPAWGHAPYAQTYTGGVPPAAPSYSAVPPVSPVYPAGYPAPGPLPSPRRLPVGAFWLIGLGLLMLTVEFVPDWHLGGRWLLPILFAGLAAWVFTRRLQNHTMRGAYGLRWPVMLAVLAVLFALQSAYVLTLGQTWPVLFIAFGALLLLERVTAPPLPVVDATAAPVAPLVPDPQAPRVTWSANEPGAAVTPPQPAVEWNPHDDQKGGQ